MESGKKEKFGWIDGDADDGFRIKYSNTSNRVTLVTNVSYLESLYAAIAKTNQEPVVRELLEAIRPCPTSSET